MHITTGWEHVALSSNNLEVPRRLKYVAKGGDDLGRFRILPVPTCLVNVLTTHISYFVKECDLRPPKINYLICIPLADCTAGALRGWGSSYAPCCPRHMTFVYSWKSRPVIIVPCLETLHFPRMWSRSRDRATQRRGPPAYGNSSIVTRYLDNIYLGA